MSESLPFAAVDTNLCGTPLFRAFQKAAGIKDPFQALGIITRLLQYMAHHAPDGNLGDVSDDIYFESYFFNAYAPGVLLNAFIASGWLALENGNYILKGQTHASSALEKRAKLANQRAKAAERQRRKRERDASKEATETGPTQPEECHALSRRDVTVISRPKESKGKQRKDIDNTTTRKLLLADKEMGVEELQELLERNGVTRVTNTKGELTRLEELCSKSLILPNVANSAIKHALTTSDKPSGGLVSYQIRLQMESRMPTVPAKQAGASRLESVTDVTRDIVEHETWNPDPEKARGILAMLNSPTASVS